jgi:hypothetical protein
MARPEAQTGPLPIIPILKDFVLIVSFQLDIRVKTTVVMAVT